MTVDELLEKNIIDIRKNGSKATVTILDGKDQKNYSISLDNKALIKPIELLIKKKKKELQKKIDYMEKDYPDVIRRGTIIITVITVLLGLGSLGLTFFGANEFINTLGYFLFFGVNIGGYELATNMDYSSYADPKKREDCELVQDRIDELEELLDKVLEASDTRIYNETIEKLENERQRLDNIKRNLQTQKTGSHYDYYMYGTKLRPNYTPGERQKRDQIVEFARVLPKYRNMPDSYIKSDLDLLLQQRHLESGSSYLEEEKLLLKEIKEEIKKNEKGRRR